MSAVNTQDPTNLELSVSLRTYFDSKFEALDRANIVAYASMEKRLEGMNEFRDTLRDQAARFITRTELDTVKERIDADIRVLREYKSLLEGKASQTSVNFAMIMSAMSLLVGIASIIIKMK